MKTGSTAMKLIAVIALAIAVPQTSYTQGTRSKDVNVVNTPNVNVVNTPTVDLGASSIVGINPSSNTVQVASSSREPVLTTQVFLAEFVFQKQLTIDLAEGQVQGSSSFTVPAGLLLLIEQVSGLAIMGGNNQYPGVSFTTIANNSFAEHFLGSFIPIAPLEYPVNTIGPVYADPSSTVELLFTRKGDGGTIGACELNMTFSGHYISQ